RRAYFPYRLSGVDRTSPFQGFHPDPCVICRRSTKRSRSRLLWPERRGERCKFAIRYVLASAFRIGKGTMLHPYVAGLASHCLVFLKLGLWHCEQETINI